MSLFSKVFEHVEHLNTEPDFEASSIPVKLKLLRRISLSHELLFSYTIDLGRDELLSSEWPSVDGAAGLKKWFRAEVKCWVALKKLRPFGVVGEKLSFRCDEGLNVKAGGHFGIHGLSKTLFMGWQIGGDLC